MRSKRNWIKNSWILCLPVLILSVAELLFADVKLMTQPKPGSSEVEKFPSSYFGKNPQQPVKKWGRSPAGLQLESSSSQHRSTGGEEELAKANQFERGFVSGARERLIPSKTKGVQEVALIASDIGFFPKTVFVNRDIPVRLYVTGSSRNTLCIMMDSFQIRTQVRSRSIEEVNFTPSQAGQYRFYCPVNGMEGTMVVRELTSNLD